jgi:hypothetical protein
MSAKTLTSPLVGNWTYRSFLNKPQLGIPFNDLAFAEGTIKVKASAMEEFVGTIGGEGWELKLTGSVSYGNPYTVRFQGVGPMNNETWVYDYIGYLVPRWPNGVNQRPAIVGSVVRTMPHSNGAGGVSPAGVVASFIAVRQP